MPQPNKKQQLPEVLMVQLMDGRKVRYKLKVMMIFNKDELGRPKEAKFVHEEESVKLEGNEHFMTCYVQDGIDYADDKTLPLFEY